MSVNCWVTMPLQKRAAQNNRVTACRRYVTVMSPVAGAGPRRGPVDETLLIAVVAELPTQPVHGHADDVARGRVVEAPDVLRDRRGRHDGPAVAHQVLKQAELRPRKPRRHAVEVERALVRIETERADLEDLRGRLDPVGARASRVRADAGEELAMSEWLDDIVVRAHFERAHLVVLAGAGGEHDDRHGRSAPAQLRQQLEAIPGP